MGWIVQTLNTHMQDLDVWQWGFVIGLVVGIIWGGLKLTDWARKVRR